MEEAKKLFNHFDKNNFQYDSDFMKWKLRSVKEILETNKDHCYGVAYVAHRLIPNSRRLFIIDITRKLTDDDKEKMKRKIIPKNITAPNSNTHSFTIFPWKGKWYWFEYTWKLIQGIRPYESLDSLLNDVMEKWKNSGRLHNAIITELGLTKIGIDVNEFTDIGLVSKLLKEFSW